MPQLNDFHFRHSLKVLTEGVINRTEIVNNCMIVSL